MTVNADPITNNTTSTIVWCRMWSEEPALAHRLMTDDCLQWSAQTPGLDTVVGPDEQERLVAAYRAEHVNVFSPRVLVDGGASFAYLWDVTRPDDSVVSGADVNVLEGALVRESWTVIANRLFADPIPPAAPTGQSRIEFLCQRWCEAGAAADVATDDFRVTGADSAAGSASDRAGRAANATAAPRLLVHRAPVVDVANGRAALLRTDPRDGAGGIDVPAFRGGRIAQVWSLPGRRPFRY